MRLKRGFFYLLVATLALPLWARDRRAARKAFQNAHQLHQALRQKPAPRRTVGDYQRAIYLYRRVIDHDPTYGACDDALFAIAFLYEEGGIRFKRETWRSEAIYFYEFLTREYPLTPHKKDALRRSARLRASPPPPTADVAAAAQKEPSGVAVNEIRYWSSQDYTRLVIQLEHEVEFEKKVLANPDRIYFDLLQTRLRDELDRSYDVNGVFLKRVRVGENRPGVVRVVLDFEAISSHSVFALYDPYRIVIDTRGSKSSDQVSTSKTIKTAEAVISLEERPTSRSVVVEKPAVSDREGHLTLTRTLGLKVGRIAIDPGHGGRDTGSIGSDGLKEKDLVLEVALLLKNLLEERLATEVVMTRQEDVFIPLEERTAVANQEGADLFISIHANSSRHRKVSGVETFYLHYATNDEAREVASRENAESQRNISELEDLLRKIAMGDYNRESRDLAHMIQEGLYGTMKDIRPAWRDRGVKKAPFIVLINSEMPSVLTEIGFISNPADEKYLKEEPAREQLAEALYRGIEEYLSALGSAPGNEKTASSND